MLMITNTSGLSAAEQLRAAEEASNYIESQGYTPEDLWIAMTASGDQQHAADIWSHAEYKAFKIAFADWQEWPADATLELA